MGKYQAHRDCTICVSFTRFQPDGFQFPILPVNFLFVLVIALKTVQPPPHQQSPGLQSSHLTLPLLLSALVIIKASRTWWVVGGGGGGDHCDKVTHRSLFYPAAAWLQSEAEITALRFILSRGKSAGGLVLHQKNSSTTTWWISSSYHPSQHNQQNSVAATGGSQNMNHLLGRQSRASVSVRTAVSINHWIF